MNDDIIEENLAQVLAEVYLRIPWSKIRVKSAHTFFIDRVRASSNSENFKKFLDTLLLKCNVEFLRVNSELLGNLDNDSEKVMNLIRKENVYITNYALDIVQTIKEDKK